MKKPKPIFRRPDEAELRRWCIEQAIRWPSVQPYAAQGGALGYVPGGAVNIIDRAARLLKWVKEQS